MGYSLRDGLSRDECIARLRGSRVGRVGVSIDALPAILPVNFALLRDAILLCPSETSALFHAGVGSVVAFEVDSVDDAGHVEWSILARGIGLEVIEADELAIASSLWLKTWPRWKSAGRYIVIPTTMLSGRRLDLVD